MSLSKHFTIEEFTRSGTASRKGIDNTPTPAALENLKMLAGVMEEVRKLCGNIPISPDSVYRCLELNGAVGGVPTSRHVQGLAIDFTIPGWTVEGVVNLIKNSRIKYHKVINEYDSWIHLSIPKRGEKALKQALKRGAEGYKII